MKAYLISYFREAICSAYAVEIADDYDGCPYGDSVPFAVGSNQDIVTADDSRWDRCLAIDEDE